MWRERERDAADAVYCKTFPTELECVPKQAGTLLDDVAAPLFPDDSLDAVPLYAPASALLPLKLPQQYVGDRLINPLTLAVFPAATGAATPAK